MFFKTPKTISWECPSCKNFNHIKAKAGALVCPVCAEICGKVDSADDFPTACPRCSCNDFYLVKKAHQGLGCLFVILGILLVRRTYGLSLPIAALVNWFLMAKTPAFALCYRCGAKFQGFEIPKNIKPFRQAIGAKYSRTGK